MAGCSLRVGWISVSQEELGIESLLLNVLRVKLRWFSHLFWTSTGDLPAGGVPRGDSREDLKYAGGSMSLLQLGLLPAEIKTGFFC